ncbi:hypothetical protein AURDEDRAFT_156754 [Auricularia subglabra TFB-10046 SS5]|nr:hypothetical protein AURDEDRAFT_156754 [Auricularia subglabra TFB-10046 SS5]
MSIHASSPPPHKKARQGPLFAGVAFYVAPTLAPEVYAGLCQIMEANGGDSVSMTEATHIISDTDAFDNWRAVGANAQIVTPFWVDRSIAIGAQQNPEGFSPDPRKIFSGIIACSGDLPNGDKEVMQASITAMGGQWREALTRDVTHLFCLTTKSDKYEKAMGHRAQSQVRILLPHWFDDSFNARRLIPYEQYSFPNPPLFDTSAGLSALKRTAPLASESAQHKEILFKTATLEAPVERDTKARSDVWHGLRVFLTSSLEVNEGRRTAVETMLQRGGAKIVKADNADDENSELAAVDECDVLVTRYRDGPVFARALEQGKVIGTLPWVFHVDQTERYCAPTDQLLHFPVPSWPIEGFPEKRISITNYSGSARDYLKKLVEVTGANFTATLSASNTHVIAASLSGKKTDKARAWGGIAIVNHIWLEDCFLRWKDLTPAAEKYIRFPRNGDMGTNVGECAIGRYTMEMWEEEQARRPGADKTSKSPSRRRPEMSEAGDSRADVPLAPPISGGSELVQATATNASVREAYEVEAGLIPDEDTVPPSSPPRTLRKAPPPPPAASSSKRRFSDGDDDGGKGSQRTSPLKRFKTDTAMGKAVEDKDENVIEIDDSGDNAEPARIPPPHRTTRAAKERAATRANGKSVPATRGRKRARDSSEGERQSSASPAPSNSKRAKAEESQYANAREASSSATQAPRRRRLQTVDSVASQSERSMTADIHDVHETEDDSQRRRSGRAAAAKATRTLKEVVMPDVLKFETQEKRGKRVEVALEDGVPRGQPATKKYTLKKQNNRRSKSEETDSDEPEIIENPPPRQKKDGAATQPARKVFYLATQVSISEAQTKVLAQLGAKSTSKPEQVTHLIADQVVRTQKFLTAINYAPFIVSGDWAKESVEKKTLLPEEKYLLNHAVSADKYGVDLKEAIRLAKKHKGAFLRGCTFYVTQNAVADRNLVKAVVKAAGGEVKEKIPSFRQAEQDNSYVISTKKDHSIWEPLASQGITIYTADFLLNGVLRQKLPLEDESYQLKNDE